ncbi:ABC transporter ATP-binding protein [Conexibacter woesei]|uniref:Oligopeptide/dipeptide ABC transporter, ATPase subunit n=1 Tax=Conexibacter woesei (strain DSM 14684 / CCUG 47730 / CIP 108061 / JCM 11494 / NBRC 100937 / ID131577) TaxID=469383 RepID=D3F379_CONWI|nr:oligopeptide/dipeptide ABC transporter ATP-binding protein [Conexibacter woesei]ADB50359.1 oligopeptide/dipeptide ABC transporter, ATPase subunit [Conexibacter woesei DSM 14684]
MTASVATNRGSAPLLDVRGLAVEFDVGSHRPPLRAVDGVDLSVAAGETVGLVGESGSGKTTIGRAVLGLVPVADGAIDFGGSDITHAGHRQRRELSADLQVVFQDPYSSLNPTRTIGQTLRESLWADKHLTPAGVSERVRSMLDRVGLGADAERRYPLQFSGGQRQRIAIARALMARPRLVICDEPVSALDLSVQAQVLNLLRELQAELGLGYLFVAHDLAVVRHLSRRIVVLYRGRVMEQGDAATLFERPAHPYTRALLDAAPVPDPERQRRRRAAAVRQGSASTVVPAEACPFAARCPHAIDACTTRRPPLEATPEGSLVACLRWQELRDGDA